MLGLPAAGVWVKSPCPALVSTPRLYVDSRASRLREAHRGTEAPPLWLEPRLLVPGAGVAQGTGAGLRAQILGPEADFQPGGFH